MKIELTEKHIMTNWKIIWQVKEDGLHNPLSNINDAKLPSFISWKEFINNLSLREDESWKRELFITNEQGEK